MSVRKESDDEPIGIVGWTALVGSLTGLFFALMGLARAVFGDASTAEVGLLVGLGAAFYAISFSILGIRAAGVSAKRLSEHVREVASVLREQLDEQRRTNELLRRWERPSDRDT
jgi:hypothetical protein